MNWLVCAMAGCLVLGSIEPSASMAEQPTSRKLQTVWSDLGTDDPVRADQAITALVAQAQQTISFLKKNVRPIARPEPCRLSQLIVDLDANRYSVRENATKELERVGTPVETALQKVLAENPSLEVRRRIERILKEHKRQRLDPSPDHLRLARVIEVLERIGDPAARRFLEVLARGAPGAPLTRDAEGALERLTGRSDVP